MDSYTVADQSGAVVFGAKHHLGLGKEHWDITDAQGSKVATLVHERAHMHATFIISGEGLIDATLTKTNYMPISESGPSTEGRAGGSDGRPCGLPVVVNDARWHVDGDVRAQDGFASPAVHRDGRRRSAVAVAIAIALDADQEEHKTAPRVVAQIPAVLGLKRGLPAG